MNYTTPGWGKVGQTLTKLRKRNWEVRVPGDARDAAEHTEGSEIPKCSACRNEAFQRLSRLVSPPHPSLSEVGSDIKGQELKAKSRGEATKFTRKTQP